MGLVVQRDMRDILPQFSIKDLMTHLLCQPRRVEVHKARVVILS